MISERITARPSKIISPAFTPVKSSILQRKCACGGAPGPTGECAACRRKRLGIQHKLTINQPGDKYEREADRVAEQVMRMPEPRLQRQTEPDDDEEEEELLQTKPLAQRQGTGQTLAGVALPIVHEVLSSPGQPLDSATRGFMGPRFGHDFSQVRVHTDARAAESAEAVNARAYTVANNIAFRRGEYAPETLAGRRLLAHELTHVIQQSHAFARPALQRQTEPPRIPDFPKLATALSHDIGENLYAYGHHFYRIATLYPDQPDLLEDAFARYALGQNVLETGYSFLGAESGTAEALALTTGITFKGVNFLASGELGIDYQFDLGSDLKLETGIDLAVNPDDYTDVKSVDAGVSLVGHF
jgi:hypothetical protein